MAEEREERFERRLLFDFYLHEVENMHNRVDWFLIFHGILFEAFLAARYSVHRIALGVLGCCVSYIWLVAGTRQLWDVRHLIQSMWDEEIMGKETANLFSALVHARNDFQPRSMKWARATPAFCIVLPLAVLIAWLCITVTYTELGGISWAAVGAILASLVLLTVLWATITFPKVPSEAVAHLRPKGPQK